MDETTLLSLNLQELYRVFIAKMRDLKSEKIITEKDIQKIRYGINIEFSLSKYLKYKDSEECGIFREKPKSNTIRADHNGFVDMNKFNEEIEERTGIMLNALLDYYSKDNDILQMDIGDLQ